MAFIAPSRCCRFDRLLRWMVGEKFARRCEPKIFVRVLFRSKLEEAQPFEPPMPKQFRVKWNDNDRVEVERAESLELLSSLFEKMSGVPVRGFFRCTAIVEIFFNAPSGDAMIFYTGEFPDSARDRPEMVHRKIETDIPIEFPVGWIARITFLRAPNLPARIAVPRENGRSRWRVTRRINRALWPRLSVNQTVSIENEPTQVGCLQDRFQAGRVGALGQPKTNWIDTKNIDIRISSDQNLRAHCFARMQWKQSMGRGAGDDFERAGFSQLAERGEQIAFPLLDKEASAFRKHFEIEFGELVK